MYLYFPKMMCCYCKESARKHGRDRKDNQRYRCRNCKRTFVEDRPKPLGDMRIPKDKAILALHMLAEGTSIRSVERLTGLHRDTICRLLMLVGRRCERYMDSRINNVVVRDVEADEIWSFVGMKQRTMRRKKIDDPYVGDAYTFVAIERHTKLILAWHLGKRTREHAVQFLDKLNRVTARRFQLSTDNWIGYRDTVDYCMAGKVDFATVEKRYTQPARDEARYSPPVVVGVKRQARAGHPIRERMCTSHVERVNLTIRTFVRRFARLSLGFSKSWTHHKAALAWFFMFYNFARIHGSLRVTPAMESGLTDSIWSVEDILDRVATRN